MEIFFTGAATVQAVSLNDAGDPAGQEMGNVFFLLLADLAGTFAGSVTFCGYLVDTVVEQIDDIIVYQRLKEALVAGHVAGIVRTKLLNGTFFRNGIGTAVFTLQCKDDDILFGREQGVEGLAGNAGFLTQFTYADVFKALGLKQP